MRKLTYSLIVLVPLLILVTCGGKKRETISKTGTVGTRVDLSVIENDLKGNNQIEWNFVETPGKTRLSKYDFNPMFNRPQVSFVPPDSGIYVIAYSLQDQSGDIVGTQRFEITVHSQGMMTDTTSTQKSEQVKEETTPPEKTTQQMKKPQTKQPVQKSVTPRSTSTTSSSGKRADLIPKIPGQYTVQIASVQRRSGAERLVKTLQNLGYDAYIQRAKFPDTGEIWYRVRSGKFQSYDEAKRLAARLQNETQLQDLTIWVDSMRQDT